MIQYSSVMTDFNIHKLPSCLLAGMHPSLAELGHVIAKEVVGEMTGCHGSSTGYSRRGVPN
jgi:hypothetical protein